jgi:hypothetical protein
LIIQEKKRYKGLFWGFSLRILQSKLATRRKKDKISSGEHHEFMFEAMCGGPRLLS